jgi:ribonuclease VapC
MSAANWSEILQKSVQYGRDRRRVGGLLQTRGVEVEPVTIEDADVAADLWTRRRSLSLADRLCLALAQRLACDALTVDRTWEGMPRARVIR